MDKQIRHYQKCRAKYIEMLGGKCVSCGTNEGLTFDHIDPKTKLFNVSHRLRWKEEKIIGEIRKCQLLCRSCHEEKNRKDNGEAKHGSLTMYSHHECRCEPCRASWNDWHRGYKKGRNSMEECHPYKVEVAGSSPVAPTRSELGNDVEP